MTLSPLRTDPEVRISVAIINYNYGRYLQECLDSVYEQTSQAHEIIVVDDGSEDESREILAAQGDRIRTILTENRGTAAATNTAIAACGGDVIALLDSDDLMCPERLSRLTSLYRRNPSAEWVFHSMRYFDRETRADAPPPASYIGFVTGPCDVRPALARGRLPITLPATSALSWRTAFLKSLLPIPVSAVTQDKYLKFATLATGSGYIHDEPLSRQGLHSASFWTQAGDRERRRRETASTVATICGFEQLGGALLPLSTRFTADLLLDFLLRGDCMTTDTRGAFVTLWVNLPKRRRLAALKALPRALARRAYSPSAQRLVGQIRSRQRLKLDVVAGQNS